MHDALNLLNFGACDRRKILEEDKRRVRDRLLQKQRPRENKYVKCQISSFLTLLLLSVLSLILLILGLSVAALVTHFRTLYASYLFFK